MQLYERIRLLAQTKSIPLSKIAEYIDIYPQKFNQWLNEKSQKNLWEHLPKILDNLPDLRPEWLYYGDGPMLKGADGPRVAVPPLNTAIPPTRTVLCAAGGPKENDASVEVAELRQKLMAAHERNARLSDEVLRLNEERRGLMERLSWDKVSDKAALSRPAARGGTPDQN